MAKDAIKDIKRKHGYSDELKQINAHEATYKVYAELIDWLFMNDMEFRVVVADKSQIDEKQEDYTFNDFYLRMYYRLLHHKMDTNYTYNIYMDIKDTYSSDELERFRKIMEYSSSTGRFQFIRSHESIFIQLADVLMGAISYNLRYEKGEVEGRMRAKMKLIEKVKKHSSISLSTTTSKFRKKLDLLFIAPKQPMSSLNITKEHPELLELAYPSEREREYDFHAIFKRDIEDNCQFLFRGRRIYPIKTDGEIDMVRLFKHLTREEIVAENEDGMTYPKRVFEMAHSQRPHWINHHVRRLTPDNLDVFTIERRDGEKRKVKKTYIYDKVEEYVIVLKQQYSNGFYLLTAYHLNKECGLKALEKKMKKRLRTPL